MSEILQDNMNMNNDDANALRAILKEVSQHFKAAVEFDRMRAELLHKGWIEITTNQDKDACIEWVKENCRGNYKHHKDSWVFEQSEDAAMFALKFSRT